jgi:hypothetical protein
VVQTNYPRLIVCEGYEDAAFFKRLIQEHGIPQFHIVFARGNTKFRAAIAKFQIDNPRVYNGLQKILFVADNDQKPAESLKSVCDQIQAHFKSAAFRPTAERRPTSTKPAISVMMLPLNGEQGHLERILVEPTRDTNNQCATHVDNFLANLVADKWKNDSRYGKAWLRSNLAARCVSDPFVTLGDALAEPRFSYLISLQHASLSPIIAYLRTF